MLPSLDELADELRREYHAATTEAWIAVARRAWVLLVKNHKERRVTAVPPEDIGEAGKGAKE